MYRIIVIMLAVTIFAMPMGCITTGSTSDATRTKTEGTAVGAVGGALIGGFIGFVAGGDAKSALKGAAVGAAAGGAAGYVYSSHVASKKAEYAKEEDWLNECIASAKQVNEDTRSYNSQLHTDICMLEKKTQTLRTQYNAKKARKTALLTEKRNIDALIKSTNEKLDRARFELVSQQQAVAQIQKKKDTSQSNVLDAEISKLEKLISELEQYSEDLAGLSSRMAV